MFAQASNIILLTGNLAGDFCLLADLGSKLLLSSLGSRTPDVLTAHHGRGIMLLLATVVIFPLSLSRGMRALEAASSCGMAVLALLFIVLTADAAETGFHGVTSGEVPLWSLNVRSAHIGEAFALIGFSFYLHPLMMPMLQEMPAGKTGVRIMSESVQFVILVVALGTYSYIGAMGAAAFGAETQGDIMMNDLVHTHNADLAFVIAMLVYLASCIPPLVISLRSYLAFILAGPRAPLSRRRFLALTVSIIALPLALVWRDPSMSETAFSLTGATGVCIVCYVIPVIVHLRLLFRLHAGDGGAQEPLAGGDAERRAGRGDVESGDLRGDNVAYAPKPSSATAWVVQVAWPLLVLVVGCMLSGLALYTALYGH